MQQWNFCWQVSCFSEPPSCYSVNCQLAAAGSIVQSSSAPGHPTTLHDNTSHDAQTTPRHCCRLCNGWLANIIHTCSTKPVSYACPQSDGFWTTLQLVTQREIAQEENEKQQRVNMGQEIALREKTLEHFRDVMKFTVSTAKCAATSIVHPQHKAHQTQDPLLEYVCCTTVYHMLHCSNCSVQGIKGVREGPRRGYESACLSCNSKVGSNGHTRFSCKLST